VYIIDEYMTVKYVYEIYSVYTGEVYRVYFAIPRLSEDLVFVASSKLIQMLTDCRKTQLNSLTA
jgi:hypothetical protein